jgi:hypothetical protein
MLEIKGEETLMIRNIHKSRIRSRETDRIHTSKNSINYHRINNKLSPSPVRVDFSVVVLSPAAVNHPRHRLLQKEKRKKKRLINANRPFKKKKNLKHTRGFIY